MINKNLIEDFSRLEEVEGIFLAGSYGTKTNDKNSDYDVYIYVNKEISVEKRKEITDKYCDYMELNNTFWETEDDGILRDEDKVVEIIYREMEWIENMLKGTVEYCSAGTGYTTCFWSNFVNSIILYDKVGKLKEMQDSYKREYPYELKKNIIKKNYPLLKGQIPAYYYQIEKALKRDDLISVNHRISALFESYFDIIFAINEFLHPGEKKILKIIKENNLKAPKDMEKNINYILKNMYGNKEKLLEEIDLLIENLDELLKKENLYNEVKVLRRF